MISTNQFKNGSHIELEGQVFRIVEFQHVKPGKGGAFVRSKLKNVGTGAVIDKTFRAGEKVRPVRTEVRRMQYLYESGDEAVMMDMSDYDQVSLSKAVVGRLARLDRFPTTRSTCCSSTSALRTCRSRAPSRWRSSRPTRACAATPSRAAGTSPPRSSRASIVQVPLFVNEGDRVRVDTRTREYVSRA